MLECWIKSLDYYLNKMPRKAKKVAEEEEIQQENEEEVVILQKRTRYGRKVKKPVRYEPTEKVEDDYSESDYTSENDESERICSESGSGSEYEDSIEGDDSDADEHGNLKDFVTYREDESEEEEEEELLEESEDEYITSEDEESEDEENK